ncbi:NAD(+) diphosphatase [Vibrio sonorensis]|uniref:NAD(+) diphosphatase n=1 Tax=Vibrio sonorensis TaxID=1004316 RepID=UPI0008D98BC9|nr:NAD(+) diphosphatase [Vibrio sonorensis]
MLKQDDTVQSKSAYWCVMSGSDIWLKENRIPFGSNEELGIDSREAILIGEHDQKKVYWINESSLEVELEMSSIRECLHFEQDLFLLVSKAAQYSHMTQTIRFCPQCGGRTRLNHNQLAMQCGDCRTLHYPRIFPCIIVAVRKENKILLAQHPRHKNGMYTIIAGFTEVGETLEQCVAREVKEETGIEVDNIRYFGSQPWAFPSSLMMGFLADYKNGEVKPDYSELSDANWFSIDQLPDLAPKGTIARELIEYTVSQISENK